MVRILGGAQMRSWICQTTIILSITLIFSSTAYAQLTWLKCSNEKTTKIVEIDLKEMTLTTSDSEFEQYLKRFFPERHASNPDAGKVSYKIFSVTDKVIKARTTVIAVRNNIEINRYSLELTELRMADGEEYFQTLSCQKMAKAF
jgi:hypothetical protein